jgi:hypothetical protein
MSESVLSNLNELARISAISTDQIPEITSMFMEMQKIWLASPGRSLLEPLKSSIPPSWSRNAGMTYEDAWLLWMAVSASNTKRAFQTAQQYSNTLFSNAYFQPKAE